MAGVAIGAQSASQAVDSLRTAPLSERITIRRAIGREPGLARRRSGGHYLYLSADDHRRLWRGIQARAPLLATFMAGEIAAQLRDEFDAELVLRRDQVKAFLSQGDV